MSCFDSQEALSEDKFNAMLKQFPMSTIQKNSLVQLEQQRRTYANKQRAILDDMATHLITSNDDVSLSSGGERREKYQAEINTLNYQYQTLVTQELQANSQIQQIASGFGIPNEQLAIKKDINLINDAGQFLISASSKNYEEFKATNLNVTRLQIASSTGELLSLIKTVNPNSVQAQKLQNALGTLEKLDQTIAREQLQIEPSINVEKQILKNTKTNLDNTTSF